MKYNFEFKGLEREGRSERETALRKLIDEEVKRLDTRLAGFSPDEVFLRVLVEENSAHKIDRVSVTLELPEKTLVAKEETRQAEAGLKEGFAEIERQLEAYKANRRGEPEWKRKVRREELRRKKLQGIPDQPGDAEQFFTLVSPHLKELDAFVRHVVAYAQERGDLPEDEPTPDELLDAALLRAYREFARTPVTGDISHWLTEIASKQIGDEISRLKSERKRILYVDDSVPETPPPEDVSTLGDEILDVYDPDRAKKLEDLVPDLNVPTPEEQVELEELRKCVRAALNAMPKLWQRVLMLRYVDDLTGAELARAAGMAEPEIARVLGHARQYLRQKLIDGRCSFKPRNARATAQAQAGGNYEERAG